MHSEKPGTMAAAAPGRYAFGSVGAKHPPTDKMSQSSGKPFSDTTWRADSSIWGNKTYSAFNAQTASPRASDEASPTAPSGSAQLNHQSEAEPWTSSGGPRGGIWSNQDAMSQGLANSGSTSPSISRGEPNQYFVSRSAVGQTGNTLPGLSNGQTRLNPSSRPFNNPSMLENELDSNLQYTAQPKYSFDMSGTVFGRGSQDMGFTNPRYSGRENNSISMGTRPDIGPSPTTDLPQYSMSPAATNNPLNAARPSMPHHVSYPLNGNIHRNITHRPVEQDITPLFKTALNLDEPSLDVDPTNIPPSGYASLANPGHHQISAISAPWSNEYGAGRLSAAGYGSDGMGDQFPGSYAGPKRASMDRGSPAGGGHRHNFSSSRLGPGSHTRQDAFISRPSSSRNSVLGQDMDRPQANAQFFGAAQFYSAAPQFYQNSALASPYGSQSSHFDAYAPAPGFRSQLPVSSYGLPYLPINTTPVRPSREQDPGRGMRSTLLEDFRANNKSSKRYELKDIYGHIVEFSGDQHGSRFIQEKLQSANSDEKDQVFVEIEVNALQLMKDVFGNYVIQKFFEHGNQVQKKIIAGKMKGKVAELSTQMYACRVVQKALEHVLVEQQKEIVEELKPDIMRIVKDQNGNHVVQKIIAMAPTMCVPFMMAAFRGNIQPLAAHSYGCRVIQRMLEFGSDSERRELMEEVHSCAPQLIVDQYGNYVAQHIVTQGSSEDRTKIIQLVINDLLTLSKHKFASNVVEKCIQYGSEEERKSIRKKLTTNSPDGIAPLQVMMRDQFGNYVIQKMLKTLKGSERTAFVEHLRPEVEAAKITAPCRQVSAVEELMKQPREPGQAGDEASSQPTTPGLQLDSSVSPTPALTSEHNSPDSSSPPSTNLSTTEAAVHDGDRAKITALGSQPKVVVQGDDA